MASSLNNPGEARRSHNDTGQGAVPGPDAPANLKLINTALSADRKHVHLHFVTGTDQVLTIQLEMTLAIEFHQILGGVLEQTKCPDQQTRRWN
jgi:hypothetical protein